MSDAAAAPSPSDSKGEPKGASYHCDYCRSDISHVVRIKCAECADFDLCVRCFASGAHVDPHKPDHAYRVVDHVRTPLWAPDWGADEELLLLEAIEMFGMGNWSDVADHVGSKTKTQCEQHYADVYCTRPDLLPDPAKALTRKAKGEGAEDEAATVKSEAGVDSKRTGTPSAAAASSSKPVQKAHAVSKPKPKAGLGHLVGYIPNRGDFDTEWENDAELMLADMEFKEEDTKWERDLKLKVLEIYNSKLDGRAERKKFILERGLLERKEKKRTKEEREVYNNMRVFARFHTAEEHEAFVQGLINEQRLRKRIEQLQNYRLNGIRTLADGDLYETEKRKREAQLGGGKKAALEAAGMGKAGAGKKRAAADGLEEERMAKARKEAGMKGSSAAAAASASPTPAAAAGAASSATGATVANPDWDVSKMPGHELLSSQERLLCSALQLLPQHYLMIKERLVRECFQRGYLKEGQAKQLIKIDVNKTAKLFDFFVSVGWLNTHDLMMANAKHATGGAMQPQAAAAPATAYSAAAAASAKKPAGSAATPQQRPPQSSYAAAPVAPAAASSYSQPQASSMGMAPPAVPRVG